MLIATVVGSVVSTQKNENLIGCKLLIVRPQNATGEPNGKDMVAVDFAGAGVGDKVLLCTGSTARHMATKPNAPIDLGIVGIIDSMEVS